MKKNSLISKLEWQEEMLKQMHFGLKKHKKSLSDLRFALLFAQISILFLFFTILFWGFC